MLHILADRGTLFLPAGSEQILLNKGVILVSIGLPYLWNICFIYSAFMIRNTISCIVCNCVVVSFGMNVPEVHLLALPFVHHVVRRSSRSIAWGFVKVYIVVF